MLLDSLKLRSVVFEIRYPPAVEIWDHSGEIGRRFLTLWPRLKLQHAEPNKVSLVAPGIEVRTELEAAVVVMDGSGSHEDRATYVREAISIWRVGLGLHTLNRVSMRVFYVKEFPSLRDANAAINGLNVAKMPAQKVFDQPMDGYRNGLDFGFRFEDENTFTTLRVRAESLELNREVQPEFPEDGSATLKKNRLVVDFDRGIIKPVDVKHFNAEEWIKGYFHVLRRDFAKVIEGGL